MPYNPPGYYPPYYQQSPYMDQLSQLKSAPQYQQPTMPGMGQAGGNAGLLWVQGEAGAKSYLVAPNNTVLLMDSEAPRFYIKSTDPNGMPRMQIYEYAEVTSAPAAQPAQAAPVDHVTHEELNNLRAEFHTEIQKMTELFTKKQPTKKGVTETDE